MRDPFSLVVGVTALLVGGLTVLNRTDAVQVDGAVAFAVFWVGLAVLGLTASALRLRRRHPAGLEQGPHQGPQ